jgi:hypothetical protein
MLHEVLIGVRGYVSPIECNCSQVDNYNGRMFKGDTSVVVVDHHLTLKMVRVVTYDSYVDGGSDAFSASTFLESVDFVG